MGNGRKAGELWVGLGNGNAEVDPFGYIEKTGNLRSDTITEVFPPAYRRGYAANWLLVRTRLDFQGGV